MSFIPFVLLGLLELLKNNLLCSLFKKPLVSLNGYDKMFHGIWPEMETEVWQSTGNMGRTSRTDNCRYGDYLNTQYQSDLDIPAQEASYCDRYECTLRSDCLAYRNIFQPEQIDDGGEPADHDNVELEVVASNSLTEAEILEMYRGVNTINIGS